MFCFSAIILSLIVTPSLNGSASSEEPRYCIGRVRSDFVQAALDDFGVPITEYGYVAGVYIGPQRYPITIAHHALSNYDVFVNSNASDASFKFLRNADWLATHTKEYGNFSVFEHRFRLHYPPATIEPGWRSAMAQGLAVEALSKAYVMTSNATYLESARKLLNTFYVDEDEGGVTYKTDSHGWWYELIANDQGVKPRILNGHLFALLGIHEYYKTTNDSSAKYLFDQGITALKNNLDRFDYENGTYSYYDLSSPKKLPSQDYHRLILNQLQELFEITSDPTIKKYLEKWQNFELPPKMYNSETCRRTFLPPVPVFKPADIGIRIGPFENQGVNTTDLIRDYRLDIPSPSYGLNLTSQLLDYHARNISLIPYNISEIVFTLNIEEIHKPNVQVQVIFGPALKDNGWINDNLYNINAGSKDSVTVIPSVIIGEEYLRVRSINVFIPDSSSLANATFGIKIA